jgi:hypothetical protein
MSEHAVGTADVDKLSKLIRLALVADKDGEAIAAIGALKRSLQAVGLDPHFIADAFERGAAPVARADNHSFGRDDNGGDDGQDDRSDIWFAFHRRHRLSPKERAFIENIAAWSGPLSARQRQWISDITDRLEAA